MALRLGLALGIRQTDDDNKVRAAALLERVVLVAIVQARGR